MISRKEEARGDIAGAMEASAVALRQHPAFGSSAQGTAVVTGAKVREKYNKMTKQYRDESNKAQYVSGLRTEEHGPDIIRLLDEAVAKDDMAAEDRQQLRAGRAAVEERKEAQGNEVR